MVARVTIPLRLVLEVLFKELPDGEVYGLEIAERTDLLPGTIYPILQRLHHEGWLTRREEEVDPSAEKRPARVYYSLNADGAERASALLAKRKKTPLTARILGTNGWGGKA